MDEFERIAFEELGINERTTLLLACGTHIHLFECAETLRRLGLLDERGALTVKGKRVALAVTARDSDG